MKVYLESIVESNTLVDAITGKPVRMDIEMVNVGTDAGTGAIGLHTWEPAHTKRAARWRLSSCCASTEAELLAKATRTRRDDVGCTDYFWDYLCCKKP